MKTIIIGAGLTGLSLAHQLEKKGEKDYILFESLEEAGGLCRSIKKQGFIFDLAPHVLHFDSEENFKIISNLMENQILKGKRKGGILINNQIVPYPFQHNLYYLDEKTKKECLDGVFEAKEKFDENKPPSNFEQWIEMTLGKGIAGHFMFPFNKKCFCVDLKEINLDFLGKNVPQPTFDEIIKWAESDMSQAKEGHYYEFYYPKNNGINLFADKLSENIHNIHLNEKVIKINLNEKLIFTSMGKYNFDGLVSTIPLKQLIEIIKDAPEEVKKASEKLRCVNVCAVFIGINRKKVSDYHFLYLPQEDILPYRISFPGNFSKSTVPDGKSSICAEYSYMSDKKLESNDIIEKTINDLIKIGIIKNKEEVTFKDFVDMGCSYIIFDFNRVESLRIINNFLIKNNVHSIGRFGAWEYGDMEDAFVDGVNMADKLSEKIGG
jgi:protoporphyrinogen oxidase